VAHELIPRDVIAKGLRYQATPDRVRHHRHGVGGHERSGREPILTQRCGQDRERPACRGGEPDLDAAKSEALVRHDPKTQVAKLVDIYREMAAAAPMPAGRRQIGSERAGAG